MSEMCIFMMGPDGNLISNDMSCM